MRRGTPPPSAVVVVMGWVTVREMASVVLVSTVRSLLVEVVSGVGVGAPWMASGAASAAGRRGGLRG